jgi:dipeptidyl aminopeptidase/acylaminoacyl peptidase
MMPKKSKVFYIWSVVAQVFFLSGVANAGNKAWTLDAIMDLKTVVDLQINPTGTKVAYVVSSVNLKRNAYDTEIWIVSATGGTAIQLVSPHFSDSRPRWPSQGHELAFLSSRDGKAQVYIVDDLDRPPRRLTYSPTAVTDFKWSPDGSHIGYLAVNPKTAGEIKRIHSGDDAIVAGQGHKYSRLHIVSSQSGQSRIVTEADRHVTSFDWASDGSRIAYAGQATPRNRDSFNVDLYEVDLNSGRETALVVQEGRDSDPAYSRDGRLIAFHSQGGTLTYFEERRVGVVPSGGGKVRYITDNLDGDVFRGGDKFWWSGDGQELVFGAGKGTKDHLYSVSLKDGKARRFVDSAAGPSSFSLSQDGHRVVFLKSSDAAPPDVYLAEVESGGAKESRLSQVNPGVSEYPAIETKTLQWKSKDGLDVGGVLRLPVGYKQGDRVPLLVELHGGPTGVALEAFPIPRTYPEQLFAQEGFAVLAPNFRGSSNYGGKFRLANIKSQGFGDMDDVMTGIDTLVAQGVADPNRLGVMGWSYGGFLSVWIIGHTGRFKAASVGAPTTDWISWYGASDGPHEVMWTYFGGKPWDGWKTYIEHSPRYHLINAKTPLLLLHGEKDIDSTPEIYQALTDLGVPVEFVTYPREGHGIGEPMHQRDLMSRNLQWFERWVLKD